jgi:hypothetical protein
MTGSRRRPGRRILLLLAAVAILPGLGGVRWAALVWLSAIAVSLVWAYRAGRRAQGRPGASAAAEQGAPGPAARRPSAAARPSRSAARPSRSAARRAQFSRLALQLLLRRG